MEDETNEIKTEELNPLTINPLPVESPEQKKRRQQDWIKAEIKTQMQPVVEKLDNAYQLLVQHEKITEKHSEQLKEKPVDLNAFLQQHSFELSESKVTIEDVKQSLITMRDEYLAHKIEDRDALFMPLMADVIASLTAILSWLSRWDTIIGRYEFESRKEATRQVI
jgi:hypothetical protein